MRRSRRKVCREDRLSELPDSLIHLILSSLPMRDVVRTTRLSKRWKHLWTTTPYLDFRSHTYNFNKFRKSVCGPLALWKGTTILKFNIDCLFERCLTSDIDSWLLFAIEKQVGELCIELTQHGNYLNYHESDYYPRHRVESDYCAPQRLYSCSSITKLSLVSCRLKIDGNVQWNQLKSLTIEGTSSLSEDGLNRILTGAPRLEVLNLCIEESRESLNIESSSLKMINIDMYLVSYRDRLSKSAVLRIWAPNLESLEILGVSHVRCLLNCPTLNNASLVFHDRDYRNIRYGLFEEMLREVLLRISHVEKVTLSDWCIKVLSEMKEKEMIVSFSNAKFLKLHASEADEVGGVLEMFPKLMIMLVLEHSNPLDSSRRVGVRFNGCYSLLHLKTVEITWKLRHISMIRPVVKFLLKNAHMLEKMVLRLRCHRQRRYQEMLSLVEVNVLSMPRSSPTAAAEVIIVKD